MVDFRGDIEANIDTAVIVEVDGMLAPVLGYVAAFVPDPIAPGFSGIATVGVAVCIQINDLAVCEAILASVTRRVEQLRKLPRLTS